jgi:23S rRNA (guanine2445-N2)-methyltransferase / 23S rRNA (guanine2069-N7)-methyltransferase
MYSLFATTPKAMENLLTSELQSLGITNIKATVAGVAFQGDLETAYRACLWSRTANRILLVLNTFTVTSQDDLYRGVQEINWFEHLNPEDSFAVSFSAKNSEVINNTHFGTLKVKDAVVDQMRDAFGIRPNINTEQPSIRINVHLHGETAQLSLDLSGESLHRRGYRDVNIKAPMKENLAAAMLLRCGWADIAKRGGTLLDPMCGSGTLLLEGAMIAADYAPGLLRDYFGFIGWKQHDAHCWQQLCDEAVARKNTGLSKMPVIVGFDQDRHTVNTARMHVINAGLENKIHIERRDISDAAPADSWQKGLVACNPPYGERLGDEAETAELYKRFGDTLKHKFQGWHAALIISNPELGFRLGIRSQKPITLFNGALECKLLRLNIEESAFFIPKANTTEERIAQVTAQSVAPKHLEPVDTKTGSVSGSATRQTMQAPAEPENTGAVMFANRLQKNLKTLSKWAKQNAITCYRVYDADLPEYAVAIDIYQGKQTWINVQEYEPPKSIDQHKANQRLAELLAEIPRVLDVSRDNVFLKIRRKQKNIEQYEKHGETGHFHTIIEGGCDLLVNFEDYLDTGLFLDHRPIRLRIQEHAKGKRFLNLFAYTGSATVHAAVGGASHTTTVDMSNTYLNWAKRNLALNQTQGEHEFIQADCLDWLSNEAKEAQPRQYDMIFLDPPTFSNSKRMDDVFDIQIDHVKLINNAMRLLADDGVLYFSTNFRRFKIDLDALADLHINDITAATIPKDFARNPKIHYCWSIKHHA